MIYVKIACALFAVAAAGLWFLSALVKTPTTFSIYVVRPSISPTLGFLDGKYMGNAFSQDLIELANALKRQSKLSSYAAICAGISALMSVITLFDHSS